MTRIIILKYGIYISALVLLLYTLIFPIPAYTETFNATNEDELREALSIAESNGEDDTIHIAAGLYRTFGEPFTFESSEEFSLTVEGEGAGTTFLDGETQSEVFLVSPGQSATIKGLTIQNGFGAGLGISYGIIKVEDCEFINNSGVGLYSSGPVVSIVGSKFIGTTNGRALDIFYGSVFIVNNIFDSNNGGAVFLFLIPENITITNNTFVFNTTDGNGGAISMMYLQAPCIGSKEVCFSEISKGNNIDEDPLFLDVETGDVSLQPASPCRDAGDPTAPGVPAVDIYGNPRGAIPDMGAVEFNLLITPNVTNPGAYSKQNDSQSGFNIYNNIFYGNSALEEGDDIFINDIVTENCAFNFQVNLFNNDISDFYSECENTAVENGGGNGGCSLAPAGASYTFPLYLFIPALILVRRFVKKYRELSNLQVRGGVSCPELLS